MTFQCPYCGTEYQSLRMCCGKCHLVEVEGSTEDAAEVLEAFEQARPDHG